MILPFSGDLQDSFNKGSGRNGVDHAPGHHNCGAIKPGEIPRAEGLLLALRAGIRLVEWWMQIKTGIVVMLVYILPCRITHVYVCAYII